jgi:hypothetical protein
MSLEAKISSLKKPLLSLVLGSGLYLTGCTSTNMDNFASMALGPILGANSQLQAVQGNLNAALALQAASEIAQNDFESKVVENGFRKKAESEGYVPFGNLGVMKKTFADGTVIYRIPNNGDGNENFEKKEFEGGVNYPHPVFGEIVLTTCNYSEDLNGDGLLEFPQEFIGMKKSFSTSERTSIIIGSREKMTNVRYVLKNRNGEVVDKFEPKEEGFDEVRGITRSYNFSGSSSGKELSPGNYLATFYSGKDFLGKVEFIIFSQEKEILTTNTLNR